MQIVQSERGVNSYFSHNWKKTQYYGSCHSDTDRWDELPTISQPKRSRIHSIEIWHSEIIIGIEVTYQILEDEGREWKQIQFTHSPGLVNLKNSKKFTLESDEFITMIEGKYFWGVNSLTFQTNKGNICTIGGGGGSPFQMKELSNSNSRVVCFFGGAGEYLGRMAIHQIGVVFSDSEFKVNSDEWLKNYPKEWKWNEHIYYPKQFREAVKVILKMGLKNEKNEPIHPECYFYTLPIEVMFIIFNFLSRESEILISPTSIPTSTSTFFEKKKNRNCILS